MYPWRRATQVAARDKTASLSSSQAYIMGEKLMLDLVKEGPMEPSEWLLVTVASGGEKGLSPVQLQKSLFLLGQEQRCYRDWTTRLDLLPVAR